MATYLTGLERRVLMKQGPDVLGAGRPALLAHVAVFQASLCTAVALFVRCVSDLSHHPNSITWP